MQGEVHIHTPPLPRGPACPGRGGTSWENGKSRLARDPHPSAMGLSSEREWHCQLQKKNEGQRGSKWCWWENKPLDNRREKAAAWSPQWPWQPRSEPEMVTETGQRREQASDRREGSGVEATCCCHLGALMGVDRGMRNGRLGTPVKMIPA